MSRNVSSWRRLRRSNSVSSPAQRIRNSRTAADTEIPRSAALMRADRCTSSSTETVIFFISTVSHIETSCSIAYAERRMQGLILVAVGAAG